MPAQLAAMILSERYPMCDGWRYADLLTDNAQR
jgi:hypothetical protein